MRRPFNTAGGLCFFFNLTIFLISCDKDSPRLTEIKALQRYPSGSGLAFFNKHLYVVGDDAAWFLEIDSLFNVVDSIELFQSKQLRIPKDSKADIESVALLRLNKKPALLLPGSGSLAPYRNTCLVIDPETQEKKQYQLDTFYHRLKMAGLHELNIEGIAALPAGIVLASRGNKSFRRNSLVFVPNRFWEKQASVAIRIAKVGTNADTSFFTGVSGMDYSYATDQLFLTASTENTYNSYDDGSIGKSFLWIVNDISSKKRLDALNPDRIIDLEELDHRFKGHKIESVCITAEGKKKKELVLVSDDDKGGTVLFRLTL